MIGRIELWKKSDSVIINKSKCCSNKTRRLSMAQGRKRERKEERGRKRGGRERNREENR